MRTLNRLAAKQIEGFKKPRRYPDGGNLYLVVTKAGTRQWAFRYRWQGKEKYPGLGSAAPGRVTLQQARKDARRARDEITAGNDPKNIKDEARRQTDRKRTFAQVVDEYLKDMEKGWKNRVKLLGEGEP